MKEFLVLDEDLAIEIGTSDKSWDSGEQDWYFIDRGTWFIKKSTIWDGATLAPDGRDDPEKPGFPILWLRSLLHDLGYYWNSETDDFPYTRKELDVIFKLYMNKSGFKYSYIYYKAVRWFGGIASKFSHWRRTIFPNIPYLPAHLSDYTQDEIEIC